MIKTSCILKHLEEINEKYEFLGNKELFILSYCPLNDIKDSSILWIRNIEKKHIDNLNDFNNVLIISEKFDIVSNKANSHIFVENPHKVYFKILERFFTSITNNRTQIASSAVIESKKIGKNLTVGHHTYIGPDVKIGINVRNI